MAESNEEIVEMLSIESPSYELTNDLIMNGPPITPEQRISLYDSSAFEAFIKEWLVAYHIPISKKYSKIFRVGGARDKGRDVIAYINENGDWWDNYQCKQYGHPLEPSDIWIELGKHIYYSYLGNFKPAKNFYFCTSKGCGPTLFDYFRNTTDLKLKLEENWKTHCQRKIMSKTEIEITGNFKKYFDAFDFSIFKPLELSVVVSEHRETYCHPPRFGGGLVKKRPPTVEPPTAIQAHEITYIQSLLNAYSEKEQIEISAENIEKFEEYKMHLRLQRQCFYEAESLRAFARDSLPENGKYDDLLQHFFVGVIDVVLKEHSNGYERVHAVLSTAKVLPIEAHPLKHYIGTSDRGGICHQLSNQRKINWIKKK